MIVDAHCHVWERWPYVHRPVPDPKKHARAERLIAEMDAAGVERAVVICAAIGGNERNIEYAFEQAARFAGRLVVFPDVDCFWHRSHRTAGAPDRLAKLLAQWPMLGLTHYMAESEDGSWLVGEEGHDVFGLAVERRLIVSLFAMPHQMHAVCRLAALFPRMPILLHHYGYLDPRSAGTRDAIELVTAAAAFPNVYVKLSGLGNLAGPDDSWPFERLGWIQKTVIDAFGAGRVVWGSDWPVSGRWMRYGQALDVVRNEPAFAEAERSTVLGGTMARLLDRAASRSP